MRDLCYDPPHHESFLLLVLDNGEYGYVKHLINILTDIEQRDFKMVVIFFITVVNYHCIFSLLYFCSVS